MKIYISGPITGRDMAAVEMAFKEAEQKILDRGHVPVNPFTLSQQMPEDSTWIEYMRNDIPMLVHCDAILLLPGWIYSSGAKLEYEIATGMHMLIYDQTVKIPFTAERKRERRKYGQMKTE